MIEWAFYYFVICKCMSTTVCVNDSVQSAFFLVMSWTLPLSLVVIHLLYYLYLNFFIIEAWNWTEDTCLKRRWNEIWICKIIFDFLIIKRMSQYFRELYESSGGNVEINLGMQWKLIWKKQQVLKHKNSTADRISWFESSGGKIRCK